MTDIVTDVKLLPETWDKMFVQALNETIDEMLVRVKQRTPVLSGTLKDGWQRDSEFDIINDVEYAGYVEEGTIHQRPVGMLSTTINEFDSILAEKLQ